MPGLPPARSEDYVEEKKERLTTHDVSALVELLDAVLMGAGCSKAAGPLVGVRRIRRRRVRRRASKTHPPSPQALSYLREVKTRFANNRKVYDR